MEIVSFIILLLRSFTELTGFVVIAAVLHRYLSDTRRTIELTPMEISQRIKYHTDMLRELSKKEINEYN